MRNRSTRARSGWFDADRKPLAVALLVSLLAHHTFFSLLSAPVLEKRNRGLIELVAVEPAGGKAARDRSPRPEAATRADAERSTEPAQGESVTAAVPQEAPEEAERRRERDLREMRLPPVRHAARMPPRPREQRPAPEPEPEEVPEREDRRAQSVQEPVELHFVHLPDRTHEAERAPEHARFFAQRTQDVDVETRAAVTTLDGPEAPETHGRRRDAEAARVEGAPDGRPQTDDGPGEDSAPREPAAASRPRHRVAERAGARERRPDSGRPATPARPEIRPVARPGGDDASRGPARAPADGVRVAVADGGILRPERTAVGHPGEPGHGPPVPGGPEMDETPRRASAAVAAASRGEGSATGSAGGPGVDTGVSPEDLRLTWRMFEELFGEEAEHERTAFLERRLESRRFGGATDRMDRIAAQLENFTPDVRPGNQTALDALYHPFAEYITAFHRKLHRYWGDGFLISLLTYPDNHPLNDMTLRVKLEIVVNGDGTIRKVTIVHHSGNLLFDVAAIDAVYQGEPYPAPDRRLLSGDGRLYMRWGFHRNHSQCGVWNAEPYILPDPPSLHEPGEPPESEHPVPG